MAEKKAFAERFSDYVNAGFPVLWIHSHEEERVEREIAALAPALKRSVWKWTVTRGWESDRGVKRDVTVPAAALMEISNAPIPEDTILVLKDFHVFTEHAVVLRLLRDLIPVCKGRAQVIVFLSPVLKVPPEWEKEVTVVPFDLPTKKELGLVLDGVVDSVGAKKAKLDGDREALLDAALGLSTMEAENAFSLALVARHRSDGTAVKTVQSEKAGTIRRSGFLEYVEPVGGLEEVGGLRTLKKWLRKRGKAFTAKAEAFGLKAPKGVLVGGVPGCGKSLTAKCVGAAWGLPIFRLDLGKLFGGIVGESERNVREVIRLIEAVSPCILWIDEVEKGLAGAGSSGNTDSGVTARVFGTLLTWLSEKTSKVFVFATANKVENIPPEWLRKGRFDEIFSVDLPTLSERVEIFEICLKRVKRSPEAFDLRRLAIEAESFSGAEIEEAVNSGLFEAFDENEDGQLTDEHVVRAMKATRSLAKTAPKQIEAIRAWARDNATPASGEIPEVAEALIQSTARGPVRRIGAPVNLDAENEG